jgi:hypothetical protein
VKDALQAEDLSGEPAQVAASPAQRHHLEAEVVVEVDVKRRENARVVLVSDLHEPVRELPRVVVVDEGEGRGRVGLRVLLLLDEIRSNLRRRSGSMARLIRSRSMTSILRP